MHRLPGLDLLRAIAIVWVMLFHSFIVGGLGPDFAWLSRYGWAGVDIFFVLSGFLIGTQVLRPLKRGEPLSFGAFYGRRAWRILPAFAVVLALYVWFPGLREVPGLQPWWQFATFTLNLLTDTNNQAFSHAWSLCVEEHFYLVFPLLAWWLTRRSSTLGFISLCVAVVMLGVALRTTVWLHDVAMDPPRNWFLEDIYYPTWMRLDGLLMGIMLATLRVYRPQAWTRLQARSNMVLLGGIGVSCFALWLFRDRTGLLANALGWPLLSFGFGLLVFAGADRQSLLGRWRLPGAGWLAGISYSLYLSHKIAFHVVSTTFGAQLQGHGMIAFMTYAVAVLMLGAALHYLVERPCLRLRERRAIRQTSVPAT
ncbi:acyltransferase [Rhodanobacter sp. OK091]|uniref:acyltransferase family protein n=1 Tax=Rhodanobacter sp. OK091 TaxID=1881037 RepID=UPI0009146782|nr:acyltransferase [Rhodanobacter sp. OK091]SHM46857.1 Peptidoglycan/LPS O-acetylase OafA/YrhL, contains acyltransferase and SGNH-hydrolase domains [Rhodanobacter sp. OK091]